MALKLIAFGTTLISIAILVGVVYLLKDILALVVVSFLIAYVLTPIVDIIERKGINRTLIVIVMTLLILGSFAVVSTIAVSSIVGQFKNFAEDVQKQETRDRLVDTSVKLINRIPELIRLPLIK
jgi:predicted PurR-regulated permease PerM